MPRCTSLQVHGRARASVARLDGANGREILGTGYAIVRFNFCRPSIASAPENIKFMLSYDNSDFSLASELKLLGNLETEISSSPIRRLPRPSTAHNREELLCESCGTHEIFITPSSSSPWLLFIIIKT